MIEVEVRSFINEEEYNRLIELLENIAEKVNEDTQITYYFSGEQDLRIQKNNQFAKLWLKGGQIHDKQREELEVRFDREDFGELEKLLKMLGYGVEIKWYRKRHKFEWNGYEVCVDHTPGYGRIVEIEKMCEEDEEGEIYQELLDALEELDVEKTPKEKFDKRYQTYKNNWQEILEEKDLSSFQE
ncbi:MAG: CYTH domain-containing protein [Candidatus Aenigmatarchaeota archaeon]